MRTIVHSVRTLVLISALLAGSYFANAQSLTTGNGKLEVGLTYGPMIFLGDIGGLPGVGQSTGPKDIGYALTKTKFTGGIFAEYYPSELFGVRFAINIGKFEAWDSTIKDRGGDELSRKARNLDFRSPLTEGFVAFDFYPTVLLEQYDGLKGKFRPYVTGGLGVFHAKPQGIYYPGYNTVAGGKPTGPYQWVDLTPLRLEGQGFAEYPDRKPLKSIEPELVLGGGFKYYLSDKMYVGLNLDYRKTFTDQVDATSADYIDPNLFSKYLTPAQATMARQLYYRGEMVDFAQSRPQYPGLPPVGEKRGDPNQNDAYFSTTLKFGWRLNYYDQRQLRNLRCPTFY